MKKLEYLAAVAVLLTGSAHAAITISDFSNFNQTGTYVDWVAGTFTSGATDWRVQASSSGGGWVTMTVPINAAAEDTIEITFTNNPGNAATSFNLVLFSDGGSTAARWNFSLAAAGTQTLTADLNNPDAFNAGSLGTWNKANIFNEWHIQGNFSGPAPLDVTFDRLALTSVPEPTSVTLLGLASIGLLVRRSRK